VFGSSLESGGRFFVSAFCRNIASAAVKMFSHVIYCIKTFYKFYTFNSICNDNAVINCITVQHNKVSFPSTLTGHTLLLVNKNKNKHCTGLAPRPATCQVEIKPVT
jgi:hypothetical protein